MRISKQWLSEWVAVPDDTADLAERLTMAGLEVDAVEPAAPAFSDVVVGEVTACEPHPDADRLKVCQVNDGSGEPLTVVCGAPNAAVGLKAPFARVGGRLPGDFKIKAAKLRGVKSHGMLCSGKELEFSEDSAGLMTLPADAPVGMDFREWLALDDEVIEVELTPNRSDCLSMAGVAREVGVLTGADVLQPSPPRVAASVESTLPVTLSAPQACPRYCGQVVKDVNVKAATPIWMQERLRRAGIRPLGIVVDITNYVMIELGQPMHAFDLNTLAGGIDVRLARAGETLKLLNDEQVTLDEATLVIADHQKPVALAGVMGGAESAVGDETRDIFLESAFFQPAAMAGRARHYGLHTDASHRFERGVDPQLAPVALQRALSLLLQWAGGEPGPGIDALDESAMPAPSTVRFRPERANAVLGTQISEDEMHDTLTRLGMAPQQVEGAWQIQSPSWRFDIAREVDLIEEVARVHGYNRLPLRRTAAPARIPPESESRVRIDRQRMLLVDRGYQEAITYSFVSAELQTWLDPDATPLALANPLSSDLSVMRTSLWPGLVKAVQHNRNRQQRRVRLFESGLRFRGSLEALEQEPVIAGVITGPVHEAAWTDSERPVDFYDLKGDVEALLELAAPGGEFRFVSAPHPALHPGQSARIERGGEPMGWLGALHPQVLMNLDLDGPVYVFELRQSAFDHRAVPTFQPISRFPAIRRDLAIVVPEAVTAQAALDCIREAAGETLQNVSLFDVYRGPGVSDGFKSLAMGLILQGYSRTLTDHEVDAIVARAVERLAETLGAELRE
ncbi:phenylalanine--tRNA ligase subunit beta [Spiribacter sp. 2438]|uniref:phenylalanine--tRNA ligase subunit beta n=1 Tax=Spiribacter sp. 2438 TaxID=2666185 RepID=UPI0012B07596|nr:phenylalanine--tRNA ligase subunit beta [Spiribacter sp. 2438]QGM21478.1 phenylalanine--tRNA ligase subunit beta [Spiribacter sp. 2438]